MTAMRKKKTDRVSKGDQTKALILDTALEMFRERGYEETTMRAIAKKAGVLLLQLQGISDPGVLSTPSRRAHRRRRTRV